MKAEPVNSKPAIAAETDLKQEIEKIAAAYAHSFNKQDAAGIADLVASGFQVNPVAPGLTIRNDAPVLMNHDGVGIGQDLDRAPDSVGSDRVFVVVEAHQTALRDRRLHGMEAVACPTNEKRTGWAPGPIQRSTCTLTSVVILARNVLAGVVRHERRRHKAYTEQAAM